ncbi:nuclear protein [Tulasnella sp. JGI-2019a]|nr:nuclear protein [Tulasnella sp. JGI-2019a]KAG9014512.1 nuclear protein [Tulasnella sp. JGI-2019a]KAG9039768.1 nuclear protein [Tulasnella sp. JGI-2019a]
MPNSKGSGKGKEPADEATYDPEQDPEVKRRIREAYRGRQKDLEEQAKDFKNLDIASLAEGVRNADLSFGAVRAPQEALLDSRLLTTVSHLSAAKAKDLKHDGGGFDTEDFISKLVTFLGGNRIDVQADDEDDDAVEREIELNWDKLGWKALGKSQRGLGLDFMLGPLAVEPTRRTQKQRVKAEKVIDEEVRPQEVSAEELAARDEAETSKIVADLAQFLENHGEPVNLFELIVNPHSFPQSVENLFYVSFLVRLGDVAIDLLDDDSCIVYACQRPTQDDFNEGTKKNQSMWEFDEETWRLAIKTFNIKKPFIKTRPIPPESSYRFYGS